MGVNTSLPSIAAIRCRVLLHETSTVHVAGRETELYVYKCTLLNCVCVLALIMWAPGGGQVEPD